MTVLRVPRTVLSELLHPASRGRANAAQALGNMRQRRREAAEVAAALARRAEADRLARQRSSHR